MLVDPCCQANVAGAIAYLSAPERGYVQSGKTAAVASSIALARERVRQLLPFQVSDSASEIEEKSVFFSCAMLRLNSEHDCRLNSPRH